MTWAICVLTDDASAMLRRTICDTFAQKNGRSIHFENGNKGELQNNDLIEGGGAACTITAVSWDARKVYSAKELDEIRKEEGAAYSDAICNAKLQYEISPIALHDNYDDATATELCVAVGQVFAFLKGGLIEDTGSLHRVFVSKGEWPALRPLLEAHSKRSGSPDRLAARVYWKEGKRKSESGDFAGAIVALDKAVKFDSGSAPAHLYRGFAKLSINENQAALEDFDTALALGLKKKEALALKGRGIALARVGSLQKALSDLERSIALDPTDAEAASELASVKKAIGPSSSA